MQKTAVRLLVETMTQPVYSFYNRFDRKWSYKDLEISVFSGVFHPGWFVTSRMLLDKLESLDLKSKYVLELGCGTGTQSCRAAQLGAHAYASDVTPVACKNARHNAQANGLKVEVIVSDIFDEFPHLDFDYIFVNPPFMPRYPELERDFAFCCGEQYEYYEALFVKLEDHLRPGGQLIMALAESCNCEAILEIADACGFDAERIDRHRRWAETNYLFAFTAQP